MGTARVHASIASTWLAPTNYVNAFRAVSTRGSRRTMRKDTSSARLMTLSTRWRIGLIDLISSLKQHIKEYPNYGYTHHRDVSETPIQRIQPQQHHGGGSCCCQPWQAGRGMDGSQDQPDRHRRFVDRLQERHADHWPFIGRAYDQSGRRIF